MEQRLFGRTGHKSTVAIFGAAAFSSVTQAEADRAMAQVIDAGVNHIDVAPSYGEAELRIGPWMKTERERFFVGCKTTQRTRQGAADELRRSLGRLNMPAFDLYQIHAVTTLAELDAVTSKGGALEAIIQAKEEGLTKFIGITGHGFDAPALYLEALRRFDFDSVLFPINYVQYANLTYRQNAEELLRVCNSRKVGTMIIKSITKAPWGERSHTHATWYEPFTDSEQIQQAVNFALSQPVTGICTAGDIQVLPLILDACKNFTQMERENQEALIAGVAAEADVTPLFV